MNPDKSIVIVFKSDGMGMTDAQPLREKLASTFLRLINDPEALPHAVCFYTDGVKLVCDGSPILAELRALEGRGVPLVICKTCLDYLGLRDHVEVGHISAMEHIMTDMEHAENVVVLK